EDGRRAAGEWRFSYTVSDAIPRSAGRPVRFKGMSVFDLEGGKIAAYREYADTGVALLQLGFKPEGLAKVLAKRVPAGWGKPRGPTAGNRRAGRLRSRPNERPSTLTSRPSSQPTSSPPSPKSESCTPVPLGESPATWPPTRKSLPMAVGGRSSRSSGTWRPMWARNVLLFGPGQER